MESKISDNILVPVLSLTIPSIITVLVALITIMHPIVILIAVMISI
jgi:hypothetical protein